MGKIITIGRSSKQIRRELAEGLGDTYGFEMAREETNGNWLVSALYYNAISYTMPCSTMILTGLSRF